MPAFVFPGIAASDYPACRKLGDCRTYVHVDGPATLPAWMQGAAEGRSFMTSGPLVLLEVDGHLPGDVIITPDAKPKQVRARLRVRSETAPVTNVQLIVGGRIARELVVTREAGTAQWLTLEEPLELRESSWIAARGVLDITIRDGGRRGAYESGIRARGRQATMRRGRRGLAGGTDRRTDCRSPGAHRPCQASGDRLFPPLARFARA